MGDISNSMLTLASEQLLAEIQSQYESREKCGIFVKLSGAEVSDLGERILALPDNDIAMLLLHYVFNLNYDDISSLLAQEKIKGNLRYAEHILSSSMGFSENERIDKGSISSACKIALGKYTEHEGFIAHKYSRQPIRKMRKLSLIRSSSNIYIKVLQKAAIVFVVLSVSFGTVLGVNAEFFERVFHWFVETFPQFSEFRLVSDARQISFEDLLLYRPTFIPEGYTLDSSFELYPLVYLNYTYNDRDMLTIIGYMPDQAVIALNTDEAQVELVSFRGEDAFYWMINGVAHFVFVLDGYHFNIIGNIDKDVIVQIAENIRIP